MRDHMRTHNEAKKRGPKFKVFCYYSAESFPVLLIESFTFPTSYFSAFMNAASQDVNISLSAISL